MRRAWLGAVVGLGLVASGACVACGSLDKATLAGRVRALPKNAALAAVPLERRELPGAAGTLVCLRLPRAGAPRLVLLHGTPGTLYHWSRALEARADGVALADAYDVTLIELPGHGMHPDRGGARGFAPLAAHVAAALDALDAGPAVLVGHSYGGEVALRVALDRPELVDTLVLVSSAGLPRAEGEWLPEEVAMREHPLAGWGWLLNSPERVATALAPHFEGPIPGGTLEEFVLTCENADNWRTMVALARDENGDRAAALAGLDVPTVLVWGERDLAYPVDRFARRFEQAIPGAELVLVAGSGHYLTEERPEELVAALLRLGASGGWSARR